METAVASTWLTAVRLERLCIIAVRIPSSQLGSPTPDIVHECWETAGGDKEEIIVLVGILRKVGLAIEKDGILRRTSDGDRVTKFLRSDDRRPLGLALIRAGLLHDQARHLIESGTTDHNGDLTCQQRVARAGAAQLLGLLSWWDVTDWPSFVVPRTLIQELSSVWSLLPPPPETPDWVLERQAIGDRAEMYTVQIERFRAVDPGHIAWVARDSDSLGWDVEDRAATPLRRIEVKGSVRREPVFFLSENEWKKANEYAHAYEVHFWGGIDLSRQPADEFGSLRAAGFPIIVTNIAQEFKTGTWTAEAVKWRVQRAQMVPMPPIIVAPATPDGS